MAFQQTIIIGNLGRDPELKYMPSGRAVCNFSVAVTERWTDKQSQERKEKTNWFRVAVWGPQAETCAQFLAKGRQVMVIGSIEARAYTDNAGQLQASLELTARDVRFLGNRQDGGQGEYGSGDYQDYPPENLGDIPF